MCVKQPRERVELRVGMRLVHRMCVLRISD
jgi:hypothetical protein